MIDPHVRYWSDEPSPPKIIAKLEAAGHFPAARCLYEHALRQAFALGDVEH